jgi:hypothetical protein
MGPDDLVRAHLVAAHRHDDDRETLTVRGGIWLVLIVTVLVVTLVVHHRRRRQRREGQRPRDRVAVAVAVAPDTAAAATELLAALDARPAGSPRPDEPHVQQLFRLEPVSLLVPFDDPAGGSLRGSASLAAPSS